MAACEIVRAPFGRENARGRVARSAVLALGALGALTVLMALAAACVAPARAADPEFGATWHDGKAELDGYRLTVVRYGTPRVGRGALIYVTEPFSESKHVKIEDASKLPADAFDAFKLNFVRSFQTGIYDYHTMVSLFTRSVSFAPVKITFTSAEWCGQVFDHLDFRGSQVTDRFESYFEDESSSRTLDLPRDGVAEDALFILLRGLKGAFVEPGKTRTVQLLPSPFMSRLTHRPAAWTKATIERLAAPATVKVPAGTFAADVYVVRTAGREGRFEIERDYPHRIVRWAWKAEATTGPPAWLGGTDAGELTGSARLEYWKLHDVGDEKYLEKLGLEAVVK